jgi:ferritin-like metal-binding protein YciE
MAKDQLISWLNDAYAMEQGLIPILENHAKDADQEMPEAATRIRQHIDETRRHAERVEQCLRELGTSPSTVKSTLSWLMGTVQSVSTGIFQDEPVKNALSDYSAEQFEVACYKALATAAADAGQASVARLCEENMREDEQMARWLDQQLPKVVKHSLSKKAAGARR